MSQLEEIAKEIQVKHLETLRKDIEKYKENVNRCNISMIDSLSYDIGSQINYLKHAIKILPTHKRQVDALKVDYENYSNKVRQCQCVKKLGK